MKRPFIPPWLNVKVSLRARLLLAYVGLILVGFSALAVLAGGQISSGTVEDFNNQMVEQARLLARALKDPVEHWLEGEGDAAAAQSLLQTYAEQSGATVTLLGFNGRLWISSDMNSQVDPFAPEVLAAQTGQIIHDTRENAAGVVMVYAAAPIREDEDRLAIVHLAAPRSGADALVVQRWLTLAGGVVVLLLVAFGASWMLSSSLLRPLNELRQAARAVARGDFSQQMPVARSDEIGQLAQTFNHMAEQVEEMIANQRAFASNASHEMRTPLTTIRLRSEAMRDGLTDEATTQQYIVEIDEEVKRLGNLVQDLMLLSQIEDGRLDIGKEKIDPIRLAQQLASDLQTELAEKEMTLSLQTPDYLPPIAASLSHLHIVFRNILTNAIKYTPPKGAITWQMRLEGNQLYMLITDTGQGIDQEDLAHVFDRFYRGDKSRSRTIPGVGLGLPLARMIVELYEGTIRVDSAGADQGTAVEIWWPLPSGQSSR